MTTLQRGRPGLTRKALWATAALALLAGTGALGQPSGHGLPAPSPGAQPEPSGAQPEPKLSQEERWRSRFPQPVLVSDLIGRQMLDRDQGVLGHIEAVVRTSDGRIVIAFARRRFLLFRGETVAVPERVTALLGPFVMILDLTPAEIERLPAFVPAGTTPIAPTARIEMALTKH